MGSEEKVDLNNLPYAQWLEESLHNFIGKPVESICILTKFKNGEVANGYYNCSVSDKLLYAGFIQQDAMIDTLRINGLVLTETTEEDNYDDEQEELS